MKENQIFLYEIHVLELIVCLSNFFSSPAAVSITGEQGTVWAKICSVTEIQRKAKYGMI
jgi:hypothetical protein